MNPKTKESDFIYYHDMTIKHKEDVYNIINVTPNYTRLLVITGDHCYKHMMNEVL